MNSHGSSSVTTSVSGVLVVRSTQGACSSRWLGGGRPGPGPSATRRGRCRPPRSRRRRPPGPSSSAARSARPGPSLRASPPGVFRAERVVRHHDPTRSAPSPAARRTGPGTGRSAPRSRRRGRRRRPARASRRGRDSVYDGKPPGSSLDPRKRLSKPRHRRWPGSPVQRGVPPLEPGPLLVYVLEVARPADARHDVGEELVPSARHGRHVQRCHRLRRPVSSWRTDTDTRRRHAKHQHLPHPQGRGHRRLREVMT